MVFAALHVLYNSLKVALTPPNPKHKTNLVIKSDYVTENPNTQPAFSTAILIPRILTCRQKHTSYQTVYFLWGSENLVLLSR